MRIPPPTFTTAELTITNTAQNLIVQDWGQIYDYILDNPNATPVYLKIFNKPATSVTLAADTPDEEFPLEGNKVGQTLPERFITKVHNIPNGVSMAVTLNKGVDATSPGTAVAGRVLYRKAHPITLT